MSKTTIRIPTPLRNLTAGAGFVEVDAGTVGEALTLLERRHEGILQRVLDEHGRLRGFVNVFVGERNIQALGGLDAGLEEGAVISIVPAVAGGTR
ncbi:molybdenum cofactor biosynthesis protein MoaD [Acidobacteria bacterium Mor1]|nr:molybdenum cofactor biosynthesis protein MoaD [Acidobacteria bacterium Mor1]